jgi:hypothetical protein
MRGGADDAGHDVAGRQQRSLGLHRGEAADRDHGREVVEPDHRMPEPRQ